MVADSETALMKILIAVDDSPIATEVAKAVIMEFPADRAEVRVLHVVQPISTVAIPQMAAGYAPELENQKGAAHELVERIASQLRSAGFKVEAAVVEIGDTRERIVDLASLWGADLIVMGSHGRTGLKRLLLGSVAEFVVRHSSCSVQIVRRRMAV